MNEYQEFSLSRVATPDYAPQYALYGDKEEGFDRLAVFFDLHYAELVAAFLNQMIEETRGACGGAWHDYECYNQEEEQDDN